MDRRDLDYTDAAIESWTALLPDVHLDSIGITMRIRRAAAILTDAIDEVAAKHGLQTLGDYELLSVVRRSSSPLSPKALAERLLVTRSTVTGRLGRLRSAGLIVQTAHPIDGRTFYVSLSRKGRTLTDRILKESQRRQLEILEQLSAEDRASLAAGLRELMLVLDDNAPLGNTHAD